MSVPAGQRPLDKYVRFYDMTGLKKIRDGSQLSFFDFAPAKAHLELGRGVDQKDNLPPLEELLDEKDAAYVSGQANFKKYCHNKVISRKHASIRWQPTQLYPILFDEGSRHGTFIMHLGSELSFSDVPNLDEDDPKWIKVEKNGSVTLKDGDVIQLGRKVTVDGKKTDPFRLFVEVYLSDQSLKKDRFKMVEVISDDEEDVMEKTNLKLKQGGAIKTTAVKKQVIVVLSDDEDSDLEVQENDVTIMDNDESEDEHGIITCDSDEEAALSENESDAASVVESDEDGIISSEHGEESDEDDDQSTNSEDESDKEEEEGDQEEGEVIVTTSTTVDIVEHPKEVLGGEEDDFDEYDFDDIILDHFTGLEEQVLEGNAASTDELSLEQSAAEALSEYVDPYADQVFPEFDEGMAVLEPISTESHSEEEEEDDVEEDEDAASSSGSSSASSGETKITSSEADGNDGIPVEMLQEKIITEEVTTTPLAEELVITETTSIQTIAGTKRNHDEVDEAEATTTSVAMTTSTSAGGPVAPSTLSLPPHKKLKTFTAGLAAGLVAGMVGTFVGLSSLALSDSSLL